MRLGLSRTRMRISKTAVVILPIICVILMFFIIIYRLQPTFIAYADTYANNLANRVVNDAVSEIFSNGDYGNLADYKGNSAGVTAIETDTVKINKLKAEINRAIQDNIKNSQSETIYIPLGSATNFYFLAGLGPKIPVKIYPISIVNSDFNEEFSSAGINQVRHKLYLDVSIEMSFIGIAFAKTETVNTSALLIETIIVGDTPEYYGNGNIAASAE
ncbi:MAG: sporulation protein YunB [Oscillospiraceae bacterium]|nr:sporulation protein YunB [Oscillospiraceae bacterium]